ncbi:MAG: carbohydrate ABC transporter permease [Candidatus Limivivens sp.]|nr:carbohydrate ABC transporter permease [Candidatus Limivivens sp.]
MLTKQSKKTNKIILGILTYTILILTLIYTLIPFATILLTSFRTAKDAVRGPFTWPHDWSIISNYIEAWQIGKFSHYLLNSLYMMVFTVLGTLVVATLAGYSFAKFRYPGKKILYYVLLIGMMIPFQTIMLPLYFTLKSMGLLNSLTGIALLSIGTGEGFAIMMMRSFFVSIPDSMIEAARLDGCSEVQVLARVVLPNTFPAWSSLIVITAMGSWNNLLAPMIYIFKQEKYPIPYALYAFQSAHTTDYQLLAAGMMISIIPIVIVYILFQSSFQNGLMAGAVKG